MDNLPSSKRIRKFRRRILLWFNHHKRNYPWRSTRNPFRILIAEMMLQRTRANQVEKVYRDFFSRFKTARDVASASMKELRKVLHPLGLRWRVKKFREMTSVLVNDFNSRVPRTREELLKLPGVGDYITGMVLSLAYGKREWIVDSNVVRVFKRYFGMRTSKEGRRDRHIIETAGKYALCRNTGKANMALLDFGALICTPINPDCNNCFLSNG
ncbi:MAG: DNA glycosylase [Planctomycetota bacterium]|nr:DNA glycosylase [Planctomycetota bacterium]MDI6787151.1 DNA glycosylase [Planctomycetota bacterium]